MKNKKLWDKFLETGNINDYLNYKNKLNNKNKLKDFDEL
jgi:hypothetical protein